MGGKFDMSIGIQMMSRLPGRLEPQKPAQLSLLSMVPRRQLETTRAAVALSYLPIRLHVAVPHAAQHHCPCRSL
jgi:hypothetical protein